MTGARPRISFFLGMAIAVSALSIGSSPAWAQSLTVETELCVSVISEPDVAVDTPSGLTQALGDGTAQLIEVSPCPSADSSTEEATVSVASTRPKDHRQLNRRAWAKLVKSPDRHLGKHYRLWGCISQFDAATGPDSFRAQTSFRKERYWFTGGENALFIGDEAKLEDFVTDDVVRMDVTSLGSFSYDTQIGGNTTVPLFEVVRITRQRGTC